ncbi:rhodanese-like domain-containing protein [Spongiivirga sp. MCCC 1A20706]|uniref:rhodanese-like domain-containing protein n=1 Tax=Spongiivirga sp. MCCC 1A20706 TaxID=3160963 RepID=UPI0039777CD8
MRNFIFILIAFTTSFVHSQKNIKAVLKKFNKGDIPYMSVDSLKANQNIKILDAREPNEYKTSRLKNAIFVGYDHFDLAKTTSQLPDKNEKILVYCSIGVRSEQIARKLKKAGYTNVYNLYGGIFEWKNKTYPIYNKHQQPTDSIHVFSKDWKEYSKKGIPVY